MVGARRAAMGGGTSDAPRSPPPRDRAAHRGLARHTLVHTREREKDAVLRTEVLVICPQRANR